MNATDGALVAVPKILLFSGFGIAIFILNAIHVVFKAIEDSTALINLICTANGNSLTKCPEDTTSTVTCYDFRQKGPLHKLNCTYEHYSLMCNEIGEIRYPMEYNYWWGTRISFNFQRMSTNSEAFFRNTFKNPDNEMFPSWQLLGAVTGYWVIVFGFSTRRLNVIAKVLFQHEINLILRWVSSVVRRCGILKALYIHRNIHIGK